MTAFPKTATLEEEIQAFYTALGSAMAKWQRVEEQLAIIFAAVVSDNTRARTLANAAFHAVVNLNSKIAMIEAAMAASAFMSPAERGDMYQEWKTLRNRLGRRATRRNEMAHFAMSVVENASAGHRCYLAPNIINVEAMVRYKWNIPRRNVCGLTACGNAFQKMATDLQAFYVKRVAG